MIFSWVKKIIGSAAFPLREGNFSLRLIFWFLATPSWAWELSLLETGPSLSESCKELAKHTRMRAPASPIGAEQNGDLPVGAEVAALPSPRAASEFAQHLVRHTVFRVTVLLSKTRAFRETGTSLLCLSLQSSKQGDAFLLLTPLRYKERTSTNQQQWLPPKCRCLTLRTSAHWWWNDVMSWDYSPRCLSSWLFCGVVFEQTLYSVLTWPGVLWAPAVEKSLSPGADVQLGRQHYTNKYANTCAQKDLLLLSSYRETKIIIIVWKRFISEPTTCKISFHSNNLYNISIHQGPKGCHHFWSTSLRCGLSDSTMQL